MRLPSLVKAALLFPSLASAAGMSFGENGTRALSLGGAFAAQADDLSAVQHNPAGLAQLSGFHFLVDGQLLDHQVSFLRQDQGGQGSLPPETVRNQGGLFFLPFLAVGYGLSLADRPLTLAAGVYGPPSVGRYLFPEPNYARDNAGKYVEEPRKFAAQRYGLIESDNVILYPTVSLAFTPTPAFSVGVSAQYVVAQLHFSQMAYSGLSTPARQRDEDPAFDSRVGVDLTGQGGFTGILGARLLIRERVTLGASVRPPLTVRAKGTFALTPGEVARRLDTEVICPDRTIHGDEVLCPRGAELALALPLELRLGAHLGPFGGLSLNVEGVFEGWQSFRELVLTPTDVQLRLGSGSPAPVEKVVIPKRWNSTLGARLGASYRLTTGLTARAGAMFEQAASPDEYLSLDFAHFARLWLTGGLGYQAGPLEVTGAFAWTAATTKDVQTSEVRQGMTDPSIQGGVVGNGVYTSGGWIASLGLRGHFGGKAP